MDDPVEAEVFAVSVAADVDPVAEVAEALEVPVGVDVVAVASDDASNASPTAI